MKKQHHFKKLLILKKIARFLPGKLAVNFIFDKKINLIYSEFQTVTVSCQKNKSVLKIFITAY